MASGSGGDWRKDSFCMKDLVQKLHARPESCQLTDISFKLPDGSIVGAHKLILALASPFFEAQFFGLLATDDYPVVVKNVESSSFRKLLDFIYSSGEVDWALENMEYWNILEAAHLYLVPGLIRLCNMKLSSLPATITDNKDLVEHVNRASQLCIYESILDSGLEEIKARLVAIIKSDLWVQLDENVVLEILEDSQLKVSEGDLFKGITEWCKHNTEDTPSAINKFQVKFASKLKVTNMTKDTFLNTIGSSELISDGQFKAWAFDFMNSPTVKKDVSRFALSPLKIHQTTIESADFLEPRGPGRPPDRNQDQVDELWKVRDEYPDVNITIRIFQKVAEPVGPRPKFGILLETVHRASENAELPVARAAITERVSVKMVAKKQDGTVVKKLFKPIEDSNKEASAHRSNIFVLSKNKDERANWHVMEIVVIIDRRPKCHIKGITGEDFAMTVCMGKTQDYLNKAVSIHYDVNSTIKNAVEDIAKQLNIKGPNSNLCQWLYIFTKGYVSNLRSRRAIPNDYWTAETVEDYMRCKVINFPIGVQNEAMRRDAFRTWIISQRVADDKEKDKKNVFVCTFNPDIQEVKFLKTLSLGVETKVETLGLQEHISLGTVKVDEKFFADVTFGARDAGQAKIFIRRIFPIQSDSDERMLRDKIVVSEAIRGTSLTHIDDCHVLVVQTSKKNSESPDFDTFLMKKIREVEVICIDKHDPNNTVKLTLDPESKKSDIVGKLSSVLAKPRNMLEIHQSYSGKTITDRCAERNIKDEDDFESIFQYCESERKLFFEDLQKAGRNSPEASAAAGWTNSRASQECSPPPPQQRSSPEAVAGPSGLSPSRSAAAAAAASQPLLLEEQSGNAAAAAQPLEEQSINSFRLEEEEEEEEEDGANWLDDMDTSA